MPYYAVRNGRQPGVYSTWDECRGQVDKFTKARYKKFTTQEEALDFIGEEDGGSGYGGQHSYSYQEEYKPRQRSRSNYSSVGSSGYSSYGGKRSYSHQEESEPRQRSRSNYSSGASSGNSSRGSAIVYTDGACVDNGRNGAKAGIGVYWGDKHPRNLSERLTDGRQTNNSAEIHAAKRAIQQAKGAGIDDLVIRTDSKFLVNCSTDWVPKWKSNDWTSSTGKPVINKEELKELDSELSGINVKWEHVRGHAGIEGNEAADRLAYKGAKRKH